LEEVKKFVSELFRLASFHRAGRPDASDRHHGRSPADWLELHAEVVSLLLWMELGSEQMVGNSAVGNSAVTL
jgi:hypothetical protein